jgi:hypothetical protein
MLLSLCSDILFSHDEKRVSRVGGVFRYCFQKSVPGSLAAHVKNRMINLAKVTVLFLMAPLLPAAVYFGVTLLLLEFNCDPKFGCKGTFQLLLFFTTAPVLASGFSAFVGQIRYKSSVKKIITPAIAYGLVSLPMTYLGIYTVDSHILGFLIATSYFFFVPFFIVKVWTLR